MAFDRYASGLHVLNIAMEQNFFTPEETLSVNLGTEEHWESAGAPEANPYPYSFEQTPSVFSTYGTPDPWHPEPTPEEHHGFYGDDHGLHLDDLTLGDFHI